MLCCDCCSETHLVAVLVDLYRSVNCVSCEQSVYKHNSCERHS
jgi:hypothetical protein